MTIIYGCASSGIIDGQAPIVQTLAGKVRGENQNGVLAFKGIRYAAPPVGNLRWKPPADPASWEGIFDATRWGAVCPQIESSDSMSFRYPSSEDCLNLNVWTPGADNAKRPVIVFFHGGAWYVNSSQDPMYEGAPLARRGNIVLVTFNYRLSIFGFLYLAGMDDSQAADFKESGCLGILDQLKVLEWVRDNIANFGGDPNNVTILGNSAGAMSVCAMMSMPQAKGLFHKAIAQSGGVSTFRSVAQATEQVREFANNYLGVMDIASMRGLSTEVLRVGMKQYLEMDIQSAMRFGPVMDGIYLPANPLQSIAAGSASDIPFLCGNNFDEARYWAFFFSPLLLLDLSTMRNNIHYIDSAVNAASNIEQGYYDRHPEYDPTDVEDAGALSMRVCSDVLFRLPQVRIAEAQAANQPKTYMYLFTWPSPVGGGIYGACHTLEESFVFNSMGAESSQILVGQDPPAQLSEIMMDLWSSFARNGVPTAAGVPDWPTYDTTNRYTMQLDYRTGNMPGIISDPFSGDRHAWDGVPFDGYVPSLRY